MEQVLYKLALHLKIKCREGMSHANMQVECSRKCKQYVLILEYQGVRKK